MYVPQRCLTMYSFATATIMSTVYGYEVAPKNDPFVTTIQQFLHLIMTAMTPERAALLLAFPFCMSSWLLCCPAALTAGVISGKYSILVSGRRIQATSCGEPCARRGSVNQACSIRRGQHGIHHCPPLIWLLIKVTLLGCWNSKRIACS